MSSQPTPSAAAPLTEILRYLDGVILGKPEQVRLAVACVLARGHLLVEDVPGVGKTTLVRSLAAVLGLESKRVQFTNDLLPADILGTSIYDATTQKFRFHAGPVFTNVLIADELNRGTPRTQSAFLQAMEERRISLDGETRELPTPFFVVATQNPREQIGTYPLPESQLDRFLMRIHLGFPAPEFEIELLRGAKVSAPAPVVTLDQAAVIAHQEACDRVHCADPILAYAQRLLAQSRALGGEFAGLSPRAGIALLNVARAWAYLAGRAFVLPDDVQMVAPWVINHRLRLSSTDAFRRARDFTLSVPVD